MIWKKLVELALLGTSRSTLTPEMQEALQERGIDTSQEITKVTLEAAAFYAPLQRAGWQAEISNASRLVPCTAATKAICSTQSAKHLQVILDKYPALLVEFVEALTIHNKSLPYEFLPILFDICVKQEELCLQIQPVIGERGKWLLPLNPAWKKLQLEYDPAQWKLGTQEERLAILKQERRHRPKGALALLQSTWEADGLPEKINLLKCLKIGLSLSDEAFLEGCLDFPRKEIRQGAADLLSQLAQSQLQQRLQQLVSLITFDKKKDVLVVVFLDTENSALIRDGIDIPTKASANSKNAILKQLLRLIVPSFWETHFDTNISKIIQLFVQYDSSLSLINALISAVALHPSQKWIEAILEFWMHQYYQKNGQNIVLNPIFEVLPNDLFNKLLYQKLKNIAKLPEEQSPLIKLLQLNGQKWDKPLALLVMTLLKEWIIANASFSYSGQQYRSLLKQQAAYSIEPILYAEINAFWLKDRNNWAGWGQDIPQFLNILSFRKEIAVEMTKKS